MKLLSIPPIKEERLKMGQRDIVTIEATKDFVCGPKHLNHVAVAKGQRRFIPKKDWENNHFSTVPDSGRGFFGWCKQDGWRLVDKWELQKEKQKQD